MDAGEVPEQFGVILLLAEAGGLDLAGARALIAERIPAVPRLRQRLVRVPFGCGGPIWADDPGFDIGRHVRAVACPEPGDERALLDIALSVIMSPLPRAAPLWQAVLVTGLAEGGLALVLVLHLALADGVGGLAVLASLIDAPANPAEACFPRPAPTRASLAQDALARRLGGLRHAARSWHLLRASMGAGGGLRPPRATPGSLNQQTGSRRRLAVVRVNLAAVRAAAHRHGATANDAVLVAVAGALHRVLLARGESVGTLVVTVPASGRAQGSGPAVGNMVSPMLVSVPATGAVPDRLQQVAAQVRAHKAAATADRGAGLAVPAPGRARRLPLVHEPPAPVPHPGHPRARPHRTGHVRRIPGHLRHPGRRRPGRNIPVYFEALSYAGTLTLTVTFDPGRFPDLSALADALRDEFDLIIHHPAIER